MKHVVTTLLLLVVVGVGVASFVGATSADAKCDESEPGCSLQRWMANHVQAALAKRDLKATAQALQKAAQCAPNPKWNEGAKGWEKLAQDGVAAAKAGDVGALKKACKSCHDTWRSEYKKLYRGRPIFGDASHGAEVFDKHCDMCHPGAGEGIGPSLLSKPASVAHIRKQVREGSGRMVSFSEQRLPKQELDAVIAYLLSRTGAND